MKKAAVIILALITALLVGSCGKKEETKQITEQSEETVVNPMVESDETELKKKAGLGIKLPEKASGVTYYLINNEIGQIGFDLGKKSYTLRSKKAEAADDFSGLYYTWTENKAVKVKGNDAEAHIFSQDGTDLGSLIWFDSGKGTAYTLTIEGKTSAEDLVKTAESIVK